MMRRAQHADAGAYGAQHKKECIHRHVMMMMTGAMGEKLSFVAAAKWRQPKFLIFGHDYDDIARATCRRRSSHSPAEKAFGMHRHASP